MAAKRGGNRQAPAVVANAAAAGVPVSPAEDETQTALVSLLDATATDAPVGVDAQADPSQDEPGQATDAPDNGTEPVVNRLAALAALTGAVPATDTIKPAAPVEVTPNGRESVWADGDKELVSAIVTVTSYQGIINGARQCAYKGETLHASETVIARGVALGALVRAD